MGSHHERHVPACPLPLSVDKVKGCTWIHLLQILFSMQQFLSHCLHALQQQPSRFPPHFLTHCPSHILACAPPLSLPCPLPPSLVQGANSLPLCSLSVLVYGLRCCKKLLWSLLRPPSCNLLQLVQRRPKCSLLHCPSHVLHLTLCSFSLLLPCTCLSDSPLRSASPKSLLRFRSSSAVL